MKVMKDLAVKEILISKEEIDKKVRELGEQISADYGKEDLVVICVLNGAMVFTADLIRHISSNVILDSMVVSSYGAGTNSTGKIKILQDCRTNIENKHVLIVDDVLDSGNTLSQLKIFLQARAPKSLKTCTFLDKPSRREVEIEADYCGYEIPDAFVIGYGLDYAHYYREFPYVAVINEEVL